MFRCRYDQILVNVAAYVIPGYVCLWCAGQGMIVTTQYYIVFYHFNNS